jgi:hypothetical protein
MDTNELEVVFPPRAIPALANMRGETWQALIKQVAEDLNNDIDRTAFVLMMVRITMCTSCHADSFRALRGCSQCAVTAIRRYRGSDQDLIRLFEQAKNELVVYLKGRNG